MCLSPQDSLPWRTEGLQCLIPFQSWFDSGYYWRERMGVGVGGDTLKLVMVSVIGQETASCHLNSGEQEVFWILP